jgi:hypothetical protein
MNASWTSGRTKDAHVLKIGCCAGGSSSASYSRQRPDRSGHEAHLSGLAKYHQIVKDPLLTWKMAANQFAGPFVALPQVTGHRRHAHLLVQQQNHGLHHQRKSVPRPCPTAPRLQQLVFLTPGPRHPGNEFGAMLPKIQMPRVSPVS